MKLPKLRIDDLKYLPSLAVALLVLFGTVSSVFSQVASEEAQRHFSRGIAAAEMAHSTAGYEDYAYQIVFQTGRRDDAVGLACDGKIVLRRTGSAQ